jgi:hypothetical protein
MQAPSLCRGLISTLTSVCVCTSACMYVCMFAGMRMRAHASAEAPLESRCKGSPRRGTCVQARLCAARTGHTGTACRCNTVRHVARTALQRRAIPCWRHGTLLRAAHTWIHSPSDEPTEPTWCNRVHACRVERSIPLSTACHVSRAARDGAGMTSRRSGTNDIPRPAHRESSAAALGPARTGRSH